MVDRLSETQIHEWLDTHGHLDQSHDPGVYAIRLHIPNDPERAWHAEKDVSPPVTGFFDAIKEQGPTLRWSEREQRLLASVGSWPNFGAATQYYTGLPTSRDVRRGV